VNAATPPDPGTNHGSNPSAVTETDSALGGTFRLGDRTVHRLGYGAMQLAGPGVMGPPADPDEAVAVLRRAIELGVDHIDTSDYYGPHHTNRLIRQALAPYPDDLVIVTKVGARRDPDGSWPEALSAAELASAIEDNLRNLGLDRIDVVNLRLPGFAGPQPGSLAEPFTALAELAGQGKIAHLGVSNVTLEQLDEATSIAPVVCVQNNFNIAHRDDGAMVAECARRGIAYVPFFPLGGFTPMQHDVLAEVAAAAGASPQQVALAWLLAQSPNLLAVPGTKSRAHLEANLGAASVQLGPDQLATLDAVAAGPTP
jgi:aryl-alcohol dehydrogenase-like predicted oxidoreductase